MKITGVKQDLPLISVIIPIYNIGQYVNRCVDSVIRQTYKNIEIVLVDDGSTDNSSLICDAYKMKDERITVIHKENGGLSDARNCGIEHMTGDYLTFVDGDDYISVNCIETLYKTLIASEAKISVCKIKYVKENDKIILVSSSKFSNIKMFHKTEAIKNFLIMKDIDTSVCGKLYPKQAFKNIRFPYGKLFEDLGTTYKILDLYDEIAYCNSECYFYVSRENSIQTQKFDLKKMDEIYMASEMYDFINKKYPELVLSAKNRVISCCFHVLFGMDDTKTYKEQVQSLKVIIKKFRKAVLFDKDGRLKARFACFLSYFGLRFTKFIYDLLKIRR